MSGTPLNNRQKTAGVAVAATLVVLAGLATLGRQVTNRPGPPFQGCEQLLEHFPLDRAGDHVRKLPDGLFEYLLDDCSTVTSHGGDPGEVEGPGLSTTNTTTLQGLGAPVCASTDRYVFIYLKPSNVTSRYTTMASTMRDLVKRVDGKLVAETQNRMGTSQAYHYKVACDIGGSIRVDNVTSNQSTSSATFSNLISDLQAKGYNKTSEKYFAFWDGAINSSFSGQATVRNDSSDSSANQNNSGNSHAFAYGSTSYNTWMHEMGHNLGAVQHDAPGSTTNWHGQGTVNDDVMYYNDGSANWDSVPVCGSNTVSGTNGYDFCKGAYFAPEHRSPDGSYPGNHWNQAKCYVRWLVSTVCGTVPGPTPSPTATATATATPSGTQAVYDSALGAPKCATVQSLCDTGPTLVNGRDNMSGGIEPHQPNTVDTCTDGTVGSYHFDESLDALKVATSDGTAFAPGKSVLVTATVWAYGTNNFLDVWSAPNATSPVWSLAATVQAPGSGVRTLTATFTLPTGESVQAVRGSFRDSNSSPTAVPCTPGGYDDADDVAFAVGTGPTPTPTPTATVTATPTPTPTPTPTATGTAQCSDGIDNDADGRIDSGDDGCVNGQNLTSSYVYDPADNDEINHTGNVANKGPGGCDGTQPFAIKEHKADDSSLCHVDGDGVI